eukprot:RCo000809
MPRSTQKPAGPLLEWKEFLWKFPGLPRRRSLRASPSALEPPLLRGTSTTEGTATAIPTITPGVVTTITPGVTTTTTTTTTSEPLAPPSHSSGEASHPAKRRGSRK